MVLEVHCTPSCLQFAWARFDIDQEKVTPSGSGDGGTNHAVASLGDGARLDGYMVVTNTSGRSGENTLETVEARHLIDDGRAHIQVRTQRDGAAAANYVQRVRGLNPRLMRGLRYFRCLHKHHHKELSIALGEGVELVVYLPYPKICETI